MSRKHNVWKCDMNKLQVVVLPHKTEKFCFIYSFVFPHFIPFFFHDQPKVWRKVSRICWHRYHVNTGPMTNRIPAGFWDALSGLNLNLANSYTSNKVFRQTQWNWIICHDAPDYLTAHLCVWQSRLKVATVKAVSAQGITTKTLTPNPAAVASTTPRLATNAIHLGCISTQKLFNLAHLKRT